MPDPQGDETADLLVGQTLNGTYYIEQKIGSGGMGDVYRAIHRKLDSPVALKIVKPGLLAHISQSFTDQGVNINQAHCRATEDGRAVNTFHASVKDLDQLKSVMRSLTRIKGVYSVDRVSADVG